MTPVLETPRLILRPHTLGDLTDALAMWSSPEVTRYIGGKPATREEVWARLLRYAGHWALYDFGFWAVTEKASGRFAGDAGFADCQREFSGQPPLEGTPEAGWALSPWAQGRGLATEAIHAASRWLDANRAPARSVCMIDPGNAASFRVAARCGYREFARTLYHAEPTVLLDRRSTGA